MKTFHKLAAGLLFALAVNAPLAAQGQNPITLSGDVMAVAVSVDSDGRETTTLVEPDVIVPGDRLIFGTDYANNGSEPAANFVVTNPLPSAVRLAPDADPALIVSVDGGRSWGTLDALSVTQEDGTARAATHADVTHVRWTIASIAPGERGRVEYPAIIR